MKRRVVIGLGNPYRSDDGFGPCVMEELRQVLADQDRLDVDLVEELGEPAALVQRWTGRSLAIVVDAVRSDAVPGAIERFDWPGPPLSAGFPAPVGGRGGSHSLGLADAIAFGVALDRMPARLVFIGVVAAELGAGVGLSPKVAVAVQEVVALVRGELSA